MKVVALAGGTGSAKLLKGLYGLGVDLTVVANVGDNIWKYGVYVCPDVDIACYTLAGVADPAKGWGLKGDTFETLARLSRLGEDTWFRLGDGDLAVCLLRTELLRGGSTLSQATAKISRALGVRCNVLPATDDPVETRVVTEGGDLHLQEFWVREHGLPGVSEVRYRGAQDASVSPEVEEAMASADRVVVCPANPVTSIGPILAVPGFIAALKGGAARVTALSPMAGRAPYSGPAGKLMEAVGSRPDSAGVAKLYSGFVDCILISESDSQLRPEVESMGVECLATDTEMKGGADETRLAEELIRA